ncbi:unnamed protein product [Phytomonas sp. Hart1]|nr:unnamed protein product [Phytomonas sp. Hart1]|eukprot:CCW70339.1 unnamed protein product [Phytomonas sp. isolate Hart1]
MIYIYVHVGNAYHVIYILDEIHICISNLLILRIRLYKNNIINKCFLLRESEHIRYYEYILR